MAGLSAPGVGGLPFDDEVECRIRYGFEQLYKGSDEDDDSDSIQTRSQASER
jgi:hypothetical protein